MRITNKFVPWNMTYQDKNKNTDHQPQQRTRTAYSRKKKNSFKQTSSDNSETCRRLLPVFWAILVIVILTAGLAVALTQSTVVGWSLVGVGFFFAILGLVLSRYVKFQRKKSSSSALHDDAFQMKFYHTDIRDFPTDPVLQRGITELVYHGQSDCDICRWLRHEEAISSFSTYDEHHHHHNYDRLPPQTYGDIPHSSKEQLGTTPELNTKNYEPDIFVEPQTTYDETYTEVGSPELQTKSIDTHQEDAGVEMSTSPASPNLNSNNNNSSRTELVPELNSNRNQRKKKHWGNEVMSKDSILTTKHRKVLRNREWEVRRKIQKLEQRAARTVSFRSGIELKEITTSMESLSTRDESIMGRENSFEYGEEESNISTPSKQQ
ncbi:uncharacterized protein LOC113474040 isoform X2 [Ciona intestinalis]